MVLTLVPDYVVPPHEIVMGNFLTIVYIPEYLGSFGSNYIYIFMEIVEFIFLCTLHTKQGKTKIK
jgi:hypothetical protein